jgi:ABC-type uncharacterized transport system substrate-binding protein
MTRGVNINFDSANNILIFNVIGKPSLDEIMFSIRDSFPKYQPKNVMWDLSNLAYPVNADTPYM